MQNCRRVGVVGIDAVANQGAERFAAGAADADEQHAAALAGGEQLGVVEFHDGTS